MNPSLVRELDAEGGAILQLLDALPPGQPRDMNGHLDDKRAIATRLAKLMKRWREGVSGGETAAVKRPIPRIVETLEIKTRARR